MVHNHDEQACHIQWKSTTLEQMYMQNVADVFGDPEIETDKDSLLSPKGRKKKFGTSQNKCYMLFLIRAVEVVARYYSHTAFSISGNYTVCGIVAAPDACSRTCGLNYFHKMVIS